MKITRLYTDEFGDSHFEELEIPLENKGEIGFLSEKFPVTDLQLRTVSPDYDYDFHNPPQRQYIVLLDGGIEIETSLGVIKHSVSSGLW